MILFVSNRVQSGIFYSVWCFMTYQDVQNTVKRGSMGEIECKLNRETNHTDVIILFVLQVNRWWLTPQCHVNSTKQSAFMINSFFVPPMIGGQKINTSLWVYSDKKRGAKTWGTILAPLNSERMCKTRRLQKAVKDTSYAIGKKKAKSATSTHSGL